jgi:hypothetical protein
MKKKNNKSKPCNFNKILFFAVLLFILGVMYITDFGKMNILSGGRYIETLSVTRTAVMSNDLKNFISSTLDKF